MTTLKGQTIGFIGLGLMGKPMCRNLIKAGADLIVWNRSPEPRDEMASAGAAIAGGPAEVAARADVVILMLADTPAVEAVLSGGVLESVHAGTLIIDMGTTAVMATRGFAETVAAAGGAYVDAPVSGGTLGAEAGNLTIMAGGSDSDFQRAQPILKALGAHITHVGPVGTGQVAKAANQVIVGLNIGAVAEALMLAKHAGADPAKVREALEGGFAWSRIMEVHGQRMIDGTFAPGGKATTQRKDMAQALELAAELGIEMPATVLNKGLYEKLIDMGGGDLDHSALIKALDPDFSC
ncbi:MAG: NAD(P)-dependent oxidoreductase [Rhodospirillaceae bacterium]|nr:NAD(P)-dependent oxidoreductase [Rhodospirillaceae bacterium]